MRVEQGIRALPIGSQSKGTAVVDAQIQVIMKVEVDQNYCQ